MSEAARRYRENVVQRAVHGAGKASHVARQAAFDNQDVDTRTRALIDKVARRAWTVTDEDVAATKVAGVSEDEIFELTVCAALGQATRQLDAALMALESAMPAGAPVKEPRHDDDGGAR